MTPQQNLENVSHEIAIRKAEVLCDNLWIGDRMVKLEELIAFVRIEEHLKNIK